MIDTNYCQCDFPKRKETTQKDSLRKVDAKPFNPKASNKQNITMTNHIYRITTQTTKEDLEAIIASVSIIQTNHPLPIGGEV